MENIEQFYQEFFDILVEESRNITLSTFIEPYGLDPTAFRLYDRENLRAILYTNPQELFNDRSYRLFIYFEKGAQGKLDILDSSSENIKHHNFTFIGPFVQELIQEKFGLKREDLLFTTIQSKGFNNNNITAIKYFENMSSHYKRKIDSAIREGLQKYRNHLSKPSYYYSANSAKYAYTILDFEEIVLRVNDDDFTYQINEAIAAYDNSLYLACASTLGVAVETLCLAILDKNSIHYNSEDPTMINRLTNLLKNNNLIDKRTKNRLLQAYATRNMVSHSNSGYVVANDCHALFATIHSLANEKF